MIGTATRIVPAQWLLWPAVAGSLVLVAAGTGLIAPLVPLMAVAGLALVLAAPTRWSAAGLLLIALVADNPGERPNESRWSSPLLPLGELLYDNLRKHTGIEALRFCALELLIALLVGVALWRKGQGDRLDDPDRLGAMPNPMKLGFASFFGAIVFLEAYGLARGGDFKNSLWQVRQLFWLPLLGVLFGNAFKREDARANMLRVLMGAAFIRSLSGIFYYFAICRPAGIRPVYATTHSDSVLSVVAIVIGLLALFERPSKDHMLLNLFLQPVLFVGLIVNNRRLAFVHLAVSLVTIVILGPPRVRQFLRQSVVVVVPALLLYTAVGWNSSAGVFRPVKILRSVSAQQDDSSKTRDIENYNLIQTLKAAPILGSGFGHEYREVVQANRVDQFFAQYRFIAHNSVLWLLSLSGWIGFTFIWVLFPTAVLITLQVKRFAAGTVDRVTAGATLCALICFTMQAWGDMGLQSWMSALVLTSLAGSTGAMWTASLRSGRLA